MKTEFFSCDILLSLPLPPVVFSYLSLFDRKPKGQQNACQSIRPQTCQTALDHSKVEEKGHGRERYA